MNLLTITGIILTAISLPQMLPSFRRKAQKQGLSGTIHIPLFLTLAGILTILVGMAFELWF